MNSIHALGTNKRNRVEKREKNKLLMCINHLFILISNLLSVNLIKKQASTHSLFPCHLCVIHSSKYNKRRSQFHFLFYFLPIVVWSKVFWEKEKNYCREFMMNETSPECMWQIRQIKRIF
jgi:hypothetical protein